MQPAARGCATTAPRDAVLRASDSWSPLRAAMQAGHGNWSPLLRTSPRGGGEYAASEGAWPRVSPVGPRAALWRTSWSKM